MSDVAPKTLKSLRRWATIFLIVGIITSASGIAHNIYVQFNPAAARTYGRLVHVSIGGRDFAIPSEYFRGPIPQSPTNRLHLWIMMPDYTPYRGEITGDRAQIRAGGERHITVDVEDVDARNSLAERYNNFRNGPLSIFKPEDTNELYGLHRTLVWNKNARSPNPWVVSDLYHREADDGKVVTFIRCDADQPDKVGICNYHEFQDGRLIYTLSYGKSHLANWNLLQNRVHALVDSFSCTPRSELTSTHLIEEGRTACPT